MCQRLMLSVVAAFVLAGCGTPAWRVRAVPREEIHLPRIEPSVVLELPPPGSVVPAQLGDGTPLWLVHREDGSVSVFSALIPSTRDASSVGLIRWIPTVRRFTGTYVWDDRGTVLGNEDSDGCSGDCVFAEDGPDSARDLDALPVEWLEGEPARIRVGARIDGAWRRISPRPLSSWTLEPHEDARRMLSVEQAMTLPEGTIVSVKGSAVLASASPPRICEERIHAGLCCPDDAPRLYDVDGIPLRQQVGPEVYAHAVKLLRRYRDGFVQYDVGVKLDAPTHRAELLFAPPPDLASWDPTQPPRVPLCQ